MRIIDTGDENFSYLKEEINISMTKEEFLILLGTVAKVNAGVIKDFFERRKIKGIELPTGPNDDKLLKMYKEMKNIALRNINPSYDF